MAVAGTIWVQLGTISILLCALTTTIWAQTHDNNLNSSIPSHNFNNTIDFDNFNNEQYNTVLPHLLNNDNDNTNTEQRNNIDNTQIFNNDNDNTERFNNVAIEQRNNINNTQIFNNDNDNTNTEQRNSRNNTEIFNNDNDNTDTINNSFNNDNTDTFNNDNDNDNTNTEQRNSRNNTEIFNNDNTDKFNNDNDNTDTFNNDNSFNNDNNNTIKPVIYVNNRELLREMKQQSFLTKAFRLSGSVNDGDSLLNMASSLAKTFRKIANNHIGVTHMQGIFDELPYTDVKADKTHTLQNIITNLELKIGRYKKLVENMAHVTEEYYKYGINKYGIYGGGLVADSQYQPCCLIADNYLQYSEHFRTHINTDYFCDSGFGSGPQPQILYSAPANLTEQMAGNLIREPSIKWQYYMSVGGLTTVYPAHKVLAGHGGCVEWAGRRKIYEWILRPGARNIILLFDVGDSITTSYLHIAKTIGYGILNTLRREDRISVFGIANGIMKAASAPCMYSTLQYATDSVLQSATDFIDNLQIYNSATNHSVGLAAALDLLRRSDLGTDGALVVYASRGVVSTRTHARAHVHALRTALRGLPHNVVISCVALGLRYDDYSNEHQFLKGIAEQNFDLYETDNDLGGGEEVAPEVQSHGAVIFVESVTSIESVINNIYDVIKPPAIVGQPTVQISPPFWNHHSKEMVISLSHGVKINNEAIGLVGIDISLATLLADVTNHYLASLSSYPFVMDSRGTVTTHPMLADAQYWNGPLVQTDIGFLENYPEFFKIKEAIFNNSAQGHMALRMSEGDVHYYWKSCNVVDMIFVYVEREDGDNGDNVQRHVSSSVSSIPSSVLLHDLDNVNVCLHYNYMATLDDGMVFIPERSYISENITGRNITGFLTGLPAPVKSDISALYKITGFWRSTFKNDLSKYIIRKYVAGASGVTVVYPGILLERSYDPRIQDWYMGGITVPGTIVVSVPYIDPWGAGYIITISHTIYQGGRARMHSSEDPVVAVIAADVTVGYIYTLLLDLEPACKYQPHKEASDVEVRCFIIDNEGYLITHPSLLTPSLSSHHHHHHTRHITHQEPVLSMELLNDGILSKEWCGRWWTGYSERHYTINMPMDKIVTADSDGDGCIKYALTKISSTNLILGIINQTCAPAVAFCPCSMDDRLCLNCQLVEAGACECPCECPLLLNTCINNNNSNHTNNIPHWQTYYKSMDGAPRVLHLNTQDGNAPTCGRMRVQAHPQHHMTTPPQHHHTHDRSSLKPCVIPGCSQYTSPEACLGVAGCSWCYIQVSIAQCIQDTVCYSGIYGGISPYIPLTIIPHHTTTSTSTIVPVAGGIMAVLVLLCVGVYFYRQYNHTNTNNNTSNINRGLYTTTTSIYNNNKPIYQQQPQYDQDLLGEWRVMSPYRMNPGYTAPPQHNIGDSSDQGYSTMTQHDEYIDKNTHITDKNTRDSKLADRQNSIDSIISDKTDSNSKLSPKTSKNTDLKSKLSPKTDMDFSEDQKMSDKIFSDLKFDDKTDSQIFSDLKNSNILDSGGSRVGPNIIQVPVVVHMVDSI